MVCLRSWRWCRCFHLSRRSHLWGNTRGRWSSNMVLRGGPHLNHRKPRCRWWKLPHWPMARASRPQQKNQSTGCANSKNFSGDPFEPHPPKPPKSKKFKLSFFFGGEKFMEPFCQLFLISNFLKMNSIAQAVDSWNKLCVPWKRWISLFTAITNWEMGMGMSVCVGLMDSKQVSKQMCLSIRERMSWYYHYCILKRKNHGFNIIPQKNTSRIR